MGATEQLNVADWSRDEPINLTQVLKLAGWVATGGEAKALIANGGVRVNGIVETRKRRKMSIGDVVELGQEQRLTLVGVGSDEGA